MTGDATLQVTIFAIGLMVFGMAMAGGLLVMKRWYQQDTNQSQEGNGTEPEHSEARVSGRPAPVPAYVRAER